MTRILLLLSLLGSPSFATDRAKTEASAPAVRPEERATKRAAKKAGDGAQRLPADLHFFMHELIRLARLYTGLDDLEHYQTTRLAVPLRKGLQMLGSRLVVRGILSEPMDIFFAREADITAALAADDPLRWAEFSTATAAAKTSCQQARQRTPGWFPDAPAAEAQVPKPGTEISGLPGSPGVVEGQVFVVTGPQDFAAFPRGAVLVARTTNPAWTPLFYAASAVITECGGPLSHGAVTAREMRIPAVMSVRECLSRLTTGCTVRVDGTRGKVVLVTERSQPNLDSLPAPAMRDGNSRLPISSRSAVKKSSAPVTICLGF